MTKNICLYSLAFLLTGEQVSSVSKYGDSNDTYRLTIFPFMTDDKNEEKIVQEFQSFLFQENLEIEIEGYDTFFPNHTVIRFKISDKILKLHTRAINIFCKYVSIEIYRDIESFSERQIKYRDKYGYPFVLRDYIPHISLGTTNVDKVEICGVIKMPELSLLKLVNNEFVKIA